MGKHTPIIDPRRAVRSGGPPAVITAGLGVGATGVAGPRIESKTDPVARALAQTVGVDPQFGPVLLLAGAVLVFGLALVVPGLFDDSR
jgi:hypothetical protein